MQARGHEEVARPFRRGRGDDRRLELGEARIPHGVAQPLDDARAQHDVVVQGLAAQVEEAIGQPRFFRVILVAENRQRQVVGRAQHFHVGRIDLDLAGRKLGVHEAGVAQLHAPVDADHRLGAQLFQRGEGGRVAVGDHLRDAVMVAQVDEQHAPVVAHPMHPARQAHGGPGVGGGQLAAGVAAIGVHGASSCGPVPHERRDGSQVKPVGTAQGHRPHRNATPRPGWMARPRGRRAVSGVQRCDLVASQRFHWARLPAKAFRSTLPRKPGAVPVPVYCQKLHCWPG